MKIAKKNFADIWEDMKWDENSSDEMIWDEVQVWGRCLLDVALHRGRAQVMFFWQQHCNSFAQSTHARAWLAHGACKFLSSSTGKWFMKASMTYEKRWGEKRWAGIRWQELRWDEECSVMCGGEECSVKCGVRSVKKAVRSEKCEMWTVKCEVWSGECEVWSGECEVWSLECEECSVKCGVWRVQWEVWSAKLEVELQMWHVKQDTTFAECTHALAWLAHGACKFYRWERSYISLRQLPPRLVQVLLVTINSSIN